MATLTAMDSFTVATKNGKRMVLAGHTVRADDPIVKGREHLFADTDELAAAAADTDGVLRRPVEAATAAPGEKRNTGRRPKKN